MHVGKLLLPGGRVVFEDAENLLFEEYLFKRRVVPVGLELAEPDAQFSLYQIPGMERVAAQDLVHPHEVGMAVHYDAGVGR